MTKIEWTDKTWNPIVGCSKVSEGCRNCYAERMAKRLKAMGQPQYQDVVDDKGWTGKTQHVIHQTHIGKRSWKKNSLIFVCSMGDLFHESINPLELEVVIKTILCYPEYTFQILTKRPVRMFQYFSRHPVPDNVWLGVTAENQAAADERIPLLLNIPAKVRFVSIEPMLGAVDLTRIKWARIPVDPMDYDYDAPAPDEMWSMRNALLSRPGNEYNKPLLGIDWVICGGESGPNARPMHPEWASGLRDQCQAAGVPFFFKQWGEYFPEGVPFHSETHWVSKAQTWLGKTDVCMDATGKTLLCGGEFARAVYPVTIMRRIGRKAAGHLLDGNEYRQLPEVKS